ncbi:hypothetical protein KJ564_02020, partial [bacterium]|nr:hypothetical protein [bacterium]
DDISHALLGNPAGFGTASFMAVVWVSVVIAAFIGLHQCWKQNDSVKPVIYLLGISSLFFGVLFTVINVSTPVHLIFVFIPFLLLLSGGLFIRKNRLAWIIFCTLLLTSGVALVDHYNRETSAYDQSDWRAAGQYLSEHQQPDDAVLFMRARDAYYALKFYDRDLPEQVYYRPRHEPDTLTTRYPRTWWNSRTLDDKVEELSAQHSRLWVVETIKGWSPQDSLDIQTTQIGKYLQLHLKER